MKKNQLTQLMKKYCSSLSRTTSKVTSPKGRRTIGTCITREIKTKNGSAMIIAIIVTAFIGAIAVSTSQLVISEAQINLRYLDGIVADYAAQSAVEWGLAAAREDSSLGDESDQTSSPIKEGKLEINSQISNNLRATKFETYIWSDSSGDADLIIGNNDSRTLEIQGAGDIVWQLIGIEQTAGDNCPATDSLHIYLNITDDSGKTSILNRYSNNSGVWPESSIDNSFYESKSISTLTVRPLILTGVMPSFTNIEEANLKFVADDCEYKTLWNINAPTATINTAKKTIRGIGLYGDVQKSLETNY